MYMFSRIIDYIKSWLYYPKMKKCLDDRNLSACNPWNNERFARFKYASWHCKLEKIKELGGFVMRIPSEFDNQDNSDGYVSAYCFKCYQDEKIDTMGVTK